jgi:serine/threonine protein kinase
VEDTPRTDGSKTPFSEQFIASLKTVRSEFLKALFFQTQADLQRSEMSSSSLMTPTFGHPPIGAFIDRKSLELVEILGTGGYGVVYRAVEVRSRKPRSYAVKCLPGIRESGTRRQLHMREIALHQLASAHPAIITLHRVVRENNLTFLVMDYAPDGDLFGQILQEGSYLGRDTLIKRVFLQIIDAVQHCHSMGIYHRDLKPENVLCFERGLRVAITDFGLATTDERSREFKTGSVYHMSPGKLVPSKKP